MATPLNRTLKREVLVKGSTYVVTLSDEGVKMTLKGHRKGLQLSWEALVSGDAALAVALNASMGQLTAVSTKIKPAASGLPEGEPTSPSKRGKRAASPGRQR